MPMNLKIIYLVLLLIVLLSGCLKNDDFIFITQDANISDLNASDLNLTGIQLKEWSWDSDFNSVYLNSGSFTDTTLDTNSSAETSWLSKEHTGTDWNFNKIQISDTNGIVLPLKNTFAFSLDGLPTTGLKFNVSNARFEFLLNNELMAYINAISGNGDFNAQNNIIAGNGIQSGNGIQAGTFFRALTTNTALEIAQNSYAFGLTGANTTGLYFNNNAGSIELRNAGITKHYYDMVNGDFNAIRDIKASRNLEVRKETYLGNDDSSYSFFDSNGFLTLFSNARAKKEIRIGVSGFEKGVSAPTSALRAIGASGGIKKAVLQFSKTVQQDIYFEVHPNYNQDDSVNHEFHLIWIPGEAWTTGNYVWKLEYLIKAESGENILTGTPTTISADVTPANATNMIETVFAETYDLNIGQILFAHLYRDVASDNGDDVGSINLIESEYVINSFGEKMN